MIQIQTGKQLFNRYKIEKLIGEGSTGRVFLAVDSSDNALRAIKLIDVEEHKYPLEAVLRFRSEANTLKNIKHPNIIRYYDFCQDENLYGLVTEYKQGTTLRSYIQKTKQIELSTILDILIQITRALQTIHDSGLVHHDLKSANILIDTADPKPDIRILDFGLSHLIEHHQNKITGTLAYMAPEMTGILKKMIDHRADLYSLGIIAYELISKKLPFYNPEPSILIHQHLAQTPLAPKSLNPQIPDVLNEMILKLLRKDPVDRYNSSQGFLRDLSKIKRFFLKNNHYDASFTIALEDQWGSLPAENPFICRDSELSSIRKFLYSQQTICLIEGARGVGKSSLLKKVYNETISDPSTEVFFFKAPSDEKPVQLAGLKGLLQTLLDTLLNEPPDKQVEKLIRFQSFLGPHFNTLIELLPELEDLCVRNQIHIDKKKSGDYGTLCKLLIEHAIKKNTHIILIIDDCHHLDSQSLSVLVSVVKEMTADKISLIITYNREYIHKSNKSIFKNLETFQGIDQVFLNPFLESQTAELLQELFAQSLIDLPRLLKHLQDSSGGNPVKLRSLLQDLIDMELLYLEGKSWKSKTKEAIAYINKFKSIDSHNILKHFNGLELDILQRGAVFHRAFSISAILAMDKKWLGHNTSESLKILESHTKSNEQILKVLDKARNTGLISKNNDNLYYFRDHSLRAAIREQIEPELLKKYHNGVALFLHKNFLENSNSAVYDIAHHYDRGGKDYQAMRHFILAAKLTDDENYSNKQSQIYYNLAANKIRFKKVTHLASQKVFDLIFTSAFHNLNINSSSFDIQADMDLLERHVASSDENKYKLLTLKANYLLFTGMRKEMVSAAESAIKLAGIKNENFFILNCLTLLGIVPTDKSYAQRADILMKVVEISLKLKRFNDIGRSLSILVNMLAYIGKFAEAEKWIEKAKKVILVFSPEDLVAILFARGMLSIESGNFSYFKKMEKELTQVTEKINRMSSAFLDSHSARVYAMLGEFKTALHIFERILGGEDRDSRDAIMNIALHGRTVLANQMGDPASALDFYEQSLEHLKQRPDPYKKVELEIEASKAYIALGEFAKARVVLNSSKIIVSKIKSVLLATHLDFAQARLKFYKTKDPGSIKDAKVAIKKFQNMGATGYAEIYQTEIVTWDKKSQSSSSSTIIGASQESRELYQLLEINQKLSSMLDSKGLLKEVLAGAMRITGAQHGYLFLHDSTGTPELSLDSQGKKIAKKNHSYSSNVLQECGNNLQTILTRDASKEKKWNIYQSIHNQSMHSILAVPIVHQGAMHGILYLDNHAARSVFSAKDRQIVENFAIQAAIAMYNASLFEKEKEARLKTQATLEIFDRFIPKNFTNRFAQGDMKLLKAGLSKEENLTILFSDIRNFTSLCESMDVSSLFVLLNDYLKFMELPIRNAGGFVDKYIGDAIMAVFDRAPIDAIEAAIGMQKALKKLNYLKKKKKMITLTTGIGINTGNSMIGVIGSRDRIDTTVMGDTVNTASRMESLTKIYDSSILISEHTWQLVRDRENLMIRFIDKVRILGKSSPTNIYEVFNHDEKELAEKKIKYQNLMTDAWQAYQAADWTGSKKLFRRYKKNVPADHIATIFLDRIKLLEKNQPDHWDGVYLQDSK